MDDANPVAATNLFPEVPPEAWNSVTGNDGVIANFGGIEQFMSHWLTIYEYDINDGWKPKRKESN